MSNASFDIDLVQRNFASFTAELTQNLSEHHAIFVGSLAYLLYLYFALVRYNVTHSSCVALGGGDLLHAVLILAHASFVLLVILHMLPPDWALKKVMQPLQRVQQIALVAVVLLIFVVYLLMFFARHKNGPSAEEVNDRYEQEKLRQINRSYTMRTIERFYQKVRSEPGLPRRAKLAECAKMYDGQLYLSAEAEKGKVPHVTCTKLPFGETKLPVCNRTPDPAVGAPILAEFYVMASNQTVFVADQCDSYVSTKMIEIVLDAGARCLDFDLFPDTFDKHARPVVTNARDRDNHPLMLNQVTFESCLQTIVQKWFRGSRDTMDRLDPLFLHLNVHSTVNTHCCDQVALLLRKYFEEVVPGRLLGPEFHYAKNNLGQTAICALFGKVVVLVRAVGSGSSAATVSLALHEVTNGFSSVNIKEREYMELATVQNSRDFATFNRRNLTYVRASNYPYSNLSPEAAAYRSSTTRLPPDDSLFVLWMNRYTLNNDPSPALRAGVQFVSMNFQRMDDSLSKYLSFFKYTSFVYKPKQLRRLPVPYTDTVHGKYGDTEGVSCDTDYHDDNHQQTNQTHCQVKGTQQYVDAKQKDLQQGYTDIEKRAEDIRNKPVFLNAPST